MAQFKLFGKAIPLFTRWFPKAAGPRGLLFSFPLDTATDYTVNFQLTDIGLDFINGIFIDNSKNAQPFTLFNLQTGQLLFIAANSQANFALITAQGSDNIAFTGHSTGGVVVPCIFRNTEPVSDTVYSSIAAGQITGTVTVQGQVATFPLASAPTDRTAAIAAGGVSQQLMAANPARRRIIIQNPSSIAGQGIAAAEPAYFNFGGAAGVATAGSYELYPGASYDTANGTLSNGVVNINAATINHRIIATEY